MDEGMERALVAWRPLARWILDHESSSEVAEPLDAAERACEKLSGSFAPIVTGHGLNALLARASYLARTPFASLDGTGRLTPEDRSCLSGLLSHLRGAGREEAAKAIVEVLANALALLSTFIGDALVLRKLRDTWPSLPFEASDSDGEEART